MKVLKVLFSIFLLAWALGVAALVAWGLWWVWPYVLKHPLYSLICVVVLSFFLRVLTNFAVATLLLPFAFAVDMEGTRITAGFIIALCMLACCAIPWLDGVKGWGGWEWTAGIGFSVFCVELAVGFYNVLDKLDEQRE